MSAHQLPLGDEDSPDSLTINSDFAERYHHAKKKQELATLQEKYGDDSQSDTSASSEDEDGEEMTPAVDVQLLKTIAAIRSKNESVYDPDCRFFDESTMQGIERQAHDDHIVVRNGGRSGDKPLLLRDYQRNLLMEGRIPGAVEADDGSQPAPRRSEQEMQKNIKNELLSAIKAEDERLGEEQLFGDVAVQDLKGKVTPSYNEWLRGKVESDATVQTGLGEWFSKDQSKMTKEDQFLHDFIFNRGWVDSKKEVTKSRDITPSAENEEDGFESDADQFEAKYNFRFEEIEATHGPGASYQTSALYGLKTHARDVPDSVRRKETSRTEKRNHRSERKKKERDLKEKELKRLQKLKKEELEETLKTIRKRTGIDQGAKDGELREIVESLEAEEEFDPQNWDKQMASFFDESYYAQDETEKPVFSDSDQEATPKMMYVTEEQVEEDKSSSSAKRKKKSKKRKQREDREDEEDDFCMDADAMQPECSRENAANSVDLPEEVQKLKRLQSEYEQMGFEDVIAGDVVTRFRYREVPKESFGLTTAEILEADDQLLNQYISLKRLAPFRNREFDNEWLQRWKKGKKRRRKEFRETLRKQAEEAENEKIHKKVEKTKSKSSESKSRMEAFGM